MVNDVRLQNGAVVTEQVGAYNVYTGARYVPLIMGQWDSTKNYEPLSIVINQGNSYTSAQYVPAGVPLQNNGPYWFLTGNFNGQISSIETQIQDINNDITDINSLLKKLEYAPKQRIRTYRLFRMYNSNYMGYQTFTYNNGIFYFITTNNEECNLITTNISGNIRSTSSLNISGHVNSMCYYNGNLYILEITNQIVYVVSPSGTIISNFSVNDGNIYIAIFSYNNQLYLYSGLGLYKIDNESVSLYLTLTFPSDYPGEGNIDFQSCCAMDGYLYLCHNKANQISKWDFTSGYFIGYEYLGNGNEMYPYGELEDCCEVEGQLFILTGIYFSSVAQRSNFYGQLFVTNIGKYDVADKLYYDYRYPYEDTVYVNASATGTNPNGTQNDAFPTLEEACMFYNYNWLINGRFVNLSLTGDFTNQACKLTNCIARVNGTNSIIGWFDFYNVSGCIIDCQVTGTKASYGLIAESRIKIDNITGTLQHIIRNSFIYGIANFPTQMNDSILMGKNSVNNNTGSIYNIMPIELSTPINVSTGNSVNLSTRGDIINAFRSGMPLIGNIAINNADVIQYVLSTSDCTNIIANTSAIKNLHILIGGENVVDVSIIITVSITGTNVKIENSKIVGGESQNITLTITDYWYSMGL